MKKRVVIWLVVMILLVSSVYAGCGECFADGTAQPAGYDPSLPAAQATEPTVDTSKWIVGKGGVGGKSTWGYEVDEKTGEVTTTGEFNKLYNTVNTQDIDDPSLYTSAGDNKDMLATLYTKMKQNEGGNLGFNEEDFIAANSNLDFSQKGTTINIPNTPQYAQFQTQQAQALAAQNRKKAAIAEQEKKVQHTDCPSCSINTGIAAASASGRNFDADRAQKKLDGFLETISNRRQHLGDTLDKQDEYLSHNSWADTSTSKDDLTQDNINQLVKDARGKAGKDVMTRDDQVAVSAFLDETCDYDKKTDTYTIKSGLTDKQYSNALNTIKEINDHTEKAIELGQAEMDELAFQADVARAMKDQVAKGGAVSDTQRLLILSQLAYNSLQDDLKSSKGDVNKESSAWANYHNRRLGFDHQITFGSMNQAQQAAFQKENFEEISRDLILSGAVEEKTDKDGKKTYVYKDSAGEDVTMNGDDFAKYIANVQKEEQKAALAFKCGGSTTGTCNPNVDDNLDALSPGEIAAAKGRVGVKSTEATGNQAFFHLPFDGQLAVPAKAAIVKGDKIIAVIPGPDGNDIEVDTGWKCFNCPTDAGGVITGAPGETTRLEAPDGTVYDNTCAKGQTAASDCWKSRTDYWQIGGFVDWIRGGPTTGFIKGLSSAIGYRCKTCTDNRLYDFMGMLDVANLAIMGICDSKIDDFGETFAVSRTGGPSQAWAAGEVIKVESICDSLGFGYSSNCSADLNLTNKKYAYKLQLVVNAQEGRMEFNIELRGGGAEDWEILSDDVELDPENDVEIYGPPILDWHGPYTKTFTSDRLYTEVCIIFKNGDQVKRILHIGDGIGWSDAARICNDLDYVWEISPVDPEKRQYQALASSALSGGGGPGYLEGAGATYSPPAFNPPPS